MTRTYVSAWTAGRARQGPVVSGDPIARCPSLRKLVTFTLVHVRVALVSGGRRPLPRVSSITDLGWNCPCPGRSHTGPALSGHPYSAGEDITESAQNRHGSGPAFHGPPGRVIVKVHVDVALTERPHSGSPRPDAGPQDLQCPPLCYLHALSRDSQSFCPPDTYSVSSPFLKPSR